MASKSRVVPGTYRITVDALIWGWPYASGSYPPFTVAAGQIYTAPIKVQRLPYAVALKVRQGETVSFPSVARNGIPGSKVIEIYNFTGNSSLSVTAALTNGTGYNLSSSSFSINQDDKATLTVTTITSMSNAFPDTLTISSGGISKSVNLSFFVTPLNGDISTKEELAAIAGNLGGTYKLTSNITLNNWTPIGGTFTGTFDGNGKTITINQFDPDAFPSAVTSYTGLFSQTSGAEIKDLEVNLIVNQTINTSAYTRIAGISGFDKGSDFSRVAVTGNMNITVNQSGTGRAFLAGIAAAVNAGTTIKDCYCDVNLTLDTNDNLTRVGGITNINEAASSSDTVAILNCFYAGSINVDTSRGTNYAYIGGILGSTHTIVTTTIDNCAVVSPSIIYTTTSSYGYVRRIVSETSTLLTLSNCVANSGMTLTRNGTAVTITSNPSGIDGENKTAAQLATQSTYAGMGWDFVNVWQMGANWPELR
jgi:hypothetical protein